MIGALLGDVVGSRFEFKNNKSKRFVFFSPNCHFTDDSVCSMAIADILLYHYPFDLTKQGIKILENDIATYLIRYVNDYPDRGYGGRFYDWAAGLLDSKYAPYNSWGNGSAMRVSSVGWLAKNEKQVKTLAKATAEVTHNHPQGIKGAEAIAMCIYLARIGKTKEEIKEYVYDNYYPILDYFDYKALVNEYRFDVSCQNSVPQAIYCFLISEDFEDAIRTAVSIGGDTDTICCMTGAIAEAYYQDEKTEMVIQKFLEKNYIPKDFVKICKKVKETSPKVRRKK